MSKPADSFFVEFVGVPGSGKSTLSHSVANRLKETRLSLYTPTYKINETLSPYIRTFYKLPYAATSIGRNLDDCYKYIQYFQYHNVNLKLLFNWLFVKGVSIRYSKRKAITLYDQGLIQALWSFILSESKQTVDFFQNLLLKNYPDTDGIFICVEASEDIVKDRLRQRASNSSRVSGNRNARFKVDEAFKSHKEVMKTVDLLVDSHSGMNKLILMNEKRADVEKNVETIINAIKAEI